jgi:hypothetical protein
MGFMVPRLVQYEVPDLTKGELLELARDAEMMAPDEDSYIEVGTTDIAAIETGRPIRESLLKALVGPDRLARCLVKAEPDPVGEELLEKSGGEGGVALRKVTLIRNEYMAKSGPGPNWSGPWHRTEHDLLIPEDELPAMKERLLKALVAGHPSVVAEDIPLLDGGRIREVVLKAIYGDEAEVVEAETLEAVSDFFQGVRAEPLRKSLPANGRPERPAVRPEAKKIVQRAYETQISDFRAKGQMASAVRAARELEDVLASKTGVQSSKRGVRR